MGTLAVEAGVAVGCWSGVKVGWWFARIRYLTEWRGWGLRTGLGVGSAFCVTW
ncbi:hypothetical protein FHS29_004329 [Saccharothrix tamanrassetensis]|uniref:Uncharacterized protein n=1 Tax=Saccharothrix tamanrassetensis TaxID=1051531 RepID=A0A841CMY7_9PSEU|nr:hypothetical protein [Saccharothrix tamanrassetensis]